VSSNDDLPGLVKIDPWLEPYADAIRQRISRFEEKRKDYGPLIDFATSHKELGLHRDGDDWVFREDPFVIGRAMLIHSCVLQSWEFGKFVFRLPQ